MRDDEFDQGPEANRRPVAQVETGELVVSGLPEGIYSVPSMDGYVTLKVMEPLLSEFKDRGAKSLAWVAQGAVPKYVGWVEADSRVFVFGEEVPKGVVGAMVELAKAPDPIEFGEEYAESTGLCWRCGRPLVRHESVVRGCGPVCWRKVGGRDGVADHYR